MEELTGELVLVSTPCSKPTSEIKPGILCSNWCRADFRAWDTSGEYMSCKAALFTPSLCIKHQPQLYTLHETMA